MYVSRPVRGIRDDPVSGETVRLAVTVTDEDGEQSVRDAVAETGGTVVARRQFGTLVVELPELAVATLCDCAGVETIETTAAIGIEPGDAGEDIDVDE